MPILFYNIRLPDDESLLNPANYRHYRIETEYAVCGCPSPTINIPSPVVTRETSSWIYRNIYTGVIQCQLDQTCTETTEGEGMETYGVKSGNFGFGTIG